MNIVIGLLIITIGSFGQSSFYVPVKKIKNWSWESFWFTLGVFAWLIFPLLGALSTIPAGHTLIEFYSVASGEVLKCIGFGILWGIGGLTFGLSIRYLGIALGQSLAFGTCSAFGTIIPVLLKGENLFKGSGLIILIGVCIAIAGIAIIGYAGSLKSQNMPEEEKKKAIKDFALKKGLLIAIIAGLMSACFNMGLEAGASIKASLISAGAKGLLILNPVILLVTLGGFLTNASYCLFLNYKNKTFKDYTKSPGKIWINNLLFCVLAGFLWYTQFFGLGAGQSFFEKDSVMMAFSWCILMSFNVIFCNFWGIVLKEWKDSGKTTIFVLVSGITILIISVIFPQLMEIILN